MWKKVLLGLAVAYFAYMYVLPMLERFSNPDTRVNPPCPSGYERCPSGDCRLKTEVHSTCPPY